MSDDTSRDDGIIQVMSDRLANKIAAGEVVQRPASVAKELIENAVDAGASSIDLIVKDAGSTLVQVVDDGCGMSRGDARRCFERHATSKIRSIEDLDRIRTLGFRGEALASIASIAQVELKTRRVEDAAGTLVRVDGGDVTDVRPCATPPGTSIAVRNLFFNVPARRNFLKTPATELKHLTDTFQFLALAHPEIAFRMEHKGNDLYDLPAVSSESSTTGAVPEPDALRRRIVDLFHLDDDSDLVAVDDATGDLTVTGFVAHPSRARRKKKSEQFLFVNERYVQDRYLGHAVRKAYGDSLPEKTFPFFALFLGMDPRRVDVNVHPTKAEVKFDDQGGIYGFLKGAVRHALGRIQLTPQFSGASSQQDDPEQEAPGDGSSGDGSSGPLRSSSAPRSFQPRGTSDDAPPAMPNRPSESSGESGTETSASGGPASGESASGEPASGTPPSGGPSRGKTSGGGAGGAAGSSARSRRSGSSRSTGSDASPGDLSRKLYGREGGSKEASSRNASPHEADAPDASADGDAPTGRDRDDQTVWSLHGRYLLTPTDAGLMMVDQRAAHVRILYERALDRLDEGSGESQQLLFPQTVDLDPADADLLDEWADDLRALGFDLERMSGRTVAVRGVPADVRSDRETSILQDVLATLREEGRPSRSNRHEHLARSLAQQGAVPRGRTLAPPERRALLHDLMNCEMPYADPSGTPTILNLSMEEIEKRFRG